VRARTVAGLVTLIGVMVLFPVTADASCSRPTPRDAVRTSAGAFIGHFVERQADGRVLYAVEQCVKGEMGDTVVVRDEYPGITSIGNLGATPGEQYALVLRRDAGGFIANGCSSMPPAAMRAAAASGRSECLRPSVRALETSGERRPRTLRLRLVLENRDGFPSGVRVEWGDGDVTDVDFLQAAAHRRKVTRSHVYPSPGLYRIRVIARSRPATVDCFGGGTFATPARSSRARPIRVG